MKKFFTTALLFTVSVTLFGMEDAAPAVSKSLFEGQFLAHLSLAIAAVGCGLAPQAAGEIRTTMIIGLALIEALVIYALVAAFAIK